MAVGGGELVSKPTNEKGAFTKPAAVSQQFESRALPATSQSIFQATQQQLCTCPKILEGVRSREALRAFSLLLMLLILPMLLIPHSTDQFSVAHQSARQDSPDQVVSNLLGEGESDPKCKQ